MTNNKLTSDCQEYIDVNTETPAEDLLFVETTGSKAFWPFAGRTVQTVTELRAGWAAHAVTSLPLVVHRPHPSTRSWGATNPVVAFRGPSLFDGRPILVVVYALRGSLNRKTGPMAQVLICPANVPPYEAVKNGADSAVCQACPLRPLMGGGCYVTTGKYIPRVYEVAKDQVPDLDAACAAIRHSGLTLRVGAWGDPAAVPFEVIERLVDAARSATGRARHTMYTSSWQTCDQRLRDVAMASVRTPQERDYAKAAGWRTFRVKVPEAPVLARERACPGSKHEVTCSQCLLCSGGMVGGDIVVDAHGSVGVIRAFRAAVAPTTANGFLGAPAFGTLQDLLGLADLDLGRSIFSSTTD